MPKEYIEREAALKVCEMHYQHCLEMHDWCGDATADNIQEDIKTIPAADVVEVRHGRWEWDEHAIDWGLGGWVCGECKSINDNIPTTPEINPYAWVGSNYCPNCGVKMEGGCRRCG